MGLNINGSWEEDPGRVKEEVRTYFENKFKGLVRESPNLDGVPIRNRINKVLPSVIDAGQFAFLGGRGLLDSVVVANEWAHDAKMRKKSSMAFKVDFEKA